METTLRKSQKTPVFFNLQIYTHLIMSDYPLKDLLSEQCLYAPRAQYALFIWTDGK